MSDSIPNYGPSTIETIDGAFLDYVEGLNLFATTINGFEKVPVIWASAERAYQIKNNREIRDENGSLIPPIISIDRVSATKDVQRKGRFQANLSPNRDYYTYTKTISQDKTSKFANADAIKKKGQINFKTSKVSNKQIYKFISIPIPVYITVEYKIHIFTNYQSQMNEIIQPFMSRVAQNYFLIEKDSHRYECFMDQNFEKESTAVLEENERKYKSTVTVKVLGYLIGEGNNQEKPQTKETESAAELKLPRETLSFIGEETRVVQSRRVSNEGFQIYSGLLQKKVFLIGDSVNSIYTINHNFNTRDIIVQVRENFDNYDVVLTTVTFINLNTITIDTGGPIGVDSHSVIILG